MTAKPPSPSLAAGYAMHMRNKPSICFVSLNAYNVLSDRDAVKHVGGAEVQQGLIARGLVDRGYRVSFVTQDHGQDDGVVLEGIRVLKAYKPSAGLPIVRSFHPRITGLWRAMGRARADIYYQRMGEMLTGIVAAFCRGKTRPFVFSASSDSDCMPDLPHCGVWRERVLYRYGLRRADCVISQTVDQQRLLRENLGVDATIIRSICQDHGQSPPPDVSDTGQASKRFLWIGRFVSDKRLELLFDLAERCTDVEFDVLGDGDPNSAYVRALRARAEAIPNVHLHGQTRPDDNGKFYQGVTAAVCTSCVEGFPNVFLEAWSRGVPVLSTFDPDNLIAENGLGVVADDVSGLAVGVRDLVNSPDLRQQASQAARDYYLQNHTSEAVMPQFEKMLADTMASGHNRRK